MCYYCKHIFGAWFGSSNRYYKVPSVISKLIMWKMLNHLSKKLSKLIETCQKHHLTVIETIVSTYRNHFQLSVIDIDYRTQLSISYRLSTFGLVIDIDYRKKYFPVIDIGIDIELQLSIYRYRKLSLISNIHITSTPHHTHMHKNKHKTGALTIEKWHFFGRRIP